MSVQWSDDLPSVTERVITFLLCVLFLGLASYGAYVVWEAFTESRIDMTPAEAQQFMDARFEQMQSSYAVQPASCVICADWQGLS